MLMKNANIDFHTHTAWSPDSEAAMDAMCAAAEKAAKAALRKTFLLRKIAKLEDVKLDPKEVDAQLREMSRYYGYKEKEFRDMLEKNGGMDDLQLDLMNAKVLNLLAEAAVK